jgi:hypothetical protein
MGEKLDVHLKVNNETSNSPAIKVNLVQSIKITTPNLKKGFADIKLVSQTFKELKVQKGLLDQMVKLHIQ